MPISNGPMRGRPPATFYDTPIAPRWMPAPCCLWPEEEDLYTLMCMRVEGGRTAFEREKQNVPINPGAVRMAGSRISAIGCGSTRGRTRCK